MDMIMMKASLPAAPQMAGRPARAPEVSSSSFPEYMHRQLSGGREGKESMLGVPERQAAASSSPAERGGSSESEEKGTASLAGLLEAFMLQLQKIAQGQGEPQSGEWAVTFADTKQLAQLGKAAGMDESEIAMLRDLVQRQDGKLALEDFFTVLAHHFDQLQQARPVSVPETELPLLQALLAKMGVEPEALSKLGEQAVSGDGRLDLAKFLEEMEGLKQLQAAELTPLEAEQLRGLLEEAGATRGLQQALLRKGSPWQESFSQKQEMSLGLEQLRNLLRQAVQENKARQPQVDVPQFFRELDMVLAQAGMEKNTPGWTPVVQESVTAVYQELLKSVDLSRVRIEAAQKAAQEAAASQLGDQAPEAEEGAPVLAGEEGALFPEGEEIALASAGPESGEEETLRREMGLAETMAGRQHLQSALSAENGLGAAEQVGREWREGAEAVKAAQPTPRWAPAIQQQTMEQLSSGVLKGLKNQEHHLVLRLYPRELGEVKVEMVVRDDHVSLSFAMENSKVKEILQSNLGQFRDNLEQQGFVLGECMVSVDQGDQSETGERQQFLFAAKPPQWAKVKNVTALPEDVLYRQAGRPAREGISLII